MKKIMPHQFYEPIDIDQCATGRYPTHLALLECCEALHEHLSGISDPILEEDVIGIFEHIQGRLQCWQESKGVYDDAVRALCRAVSDEYREARKDKIDG